MYSYPWYMRGYWFVLIALISIACFWWGRIYAIKNAREIIFSEKPLPARLKYFATSRKEAIQFVRMGARNMDLIFWFFVFFYLIFVIVEFEDIFL